MVLSRRSLIAYPALGIAAPALAMPTSRLTARQATATPDAFPTDVEAAMLATMDELGIPGALVLLDSPETGVRTAALGMADLESGTPITLDTYMRIGSLTKTFTATMMLQLIDRGLLTLDDTIAHLHPDLNKLPNADSITVRHLLSMQSGLVDYTETPEIAEMAMDLDRKYTPQEIVASIAGAPALLEPGTQFMYSNTNYMISAMIAEGLTNTPYHELVQSNILDELGLTQTSVPTTAELPSPSARGYAYVPLKALSDMATPVASPAAVIRPADVSRVNPWIPGAAGAMISTLGDLHTWTTAFQHGTLLSAEMREAQFDTSNAPDADGAKYGLGVIDLDGAVGHTGGIGGFESIMLYIPSADTTAIVLVNVMPPMMPVSPTQALLQHILPM